LTYHGLAVPVGDDAGMALRLGATVVGEDGGGQSGEDEECETHVDVDDSCAVVGSRSWVDSLIVYLKLGVDLWLCVKF
jgi:hypothetical protein